MSKSDVIMCNMICYSTTENKQSTESKFLNPESLVQKVCKVLWLSWWKWLENRQVHGPQGFYEGAACAVETVRVHMELLGELQLVVVHQLVIYYDQQRPACSKGLQTTSCSCMADDQVRLLHVLCYRVLESKNFKFNLWTAVGLWKSGSSSNLENETFISTGL